MPITSDAITSTGNLTVFGTIAPARPRTELARETKTYPVALDRLRVWDAFATVLPATGGTDDLGLYGGTFATNAPKVSSGDVKNSTTTRYARFLFELPPEYIAGDTVTIRASAATETTVASSSSTIDFEVWRSDRDGTIGGSDLCATSATSINATSFSDKDFSVTPATLSPGDILDVRVTLACSDTATGTVVQPSIGSIEFRLSVQG